MATERKTLRRDTDGGEAQLRPSRAMRAVDAIREDTPARKGKHTDTLREDTPARMGGRTDTPCEDTPARKGGRGDTVRAGVSIPRGRQAASAMFDGERAIRTDAPTFSQPRTASLPVPDEGDAILSITPEGSGESVAVTLRLTTPTEGFPDGRQVKLHLLAEQYAELSLRVGGITPEAAEEILAAGKLCAAIRRGLSLLQYGDQSARKLAFKLTAKGIDRDTAEAAAAFLSRKGYIREDDTARLRVEQDLRKLWGPRRIAEDLRAQGFSADAVASALDQLSDVDFCESCAEVIHKKYRTVPADRAGQQKLIAALMRLGYDVGTAREAMRRVGRE